MLISLWFMYHVLVSFLLNCIVRDSGTGKCLASLGTFSLVTFGSRWADWQQSLPSFINQEQKVKYDRQLQSDQFSWSYVIQSTLKVILSYLYVLSQEKKTSQIPSSPMMQILLIRGQSFCSIFFYLYPFYRLYTQTHLSLLELELSMLTALPKDLCVCFPDKPFLYFLQQQRS